MSNALRLNEKDTVAVIPQHVNKGEEVVINGTAEKYILQDDIPAGHKFALKDFKEGELIYKYGIPIAKAKVDITKGSWVHDHNVIDNTEELCTKYINDYVNDEKTIDVFQRKNGKFGVANYILLVPTSARANIFAESSVVFKYKRERDAGQIVRNVADNKRPKHYFFNIADFGKKKGGNEDNRHGECDISYPTEFFPRL